MYSMVGQMCIVPRCCGPTVRARQGLEVGQLAEGDVDLAARAGCSRCGAPRPRSPPAGPFASISLRKVTFASTPEATRVAWNSVPSFSATPCTRPVLRPGSWPPRRWCGSRRPALARRRGDGVADPAHAAAHVAPDAADAVALAHHVVEQHVGRARHRRGRHRADDRVGRQRHLELLRLEPAVEDRRGRPGQDLDRLLPVVPPSLQEAEPELGELHRFPGLSDQGSGGVCTSVGSRKSATRSSIASYFGSASASFVENLETSRWVSALSGPISS